MARPGVHAAPVPPIGAAPRHRPPSRPFRGETVLTFEIRPRGPFDLSAARDFIGGFTQGIGGGAVAGTSLVMSFPVETPGWPASAAVELRQEADGTVVGRTGAPPDLLEAVQRQAERSLSLDHDGAGWSDVGSRDPIIGRLQEEHRYLRPVCFYSAYEAATSFVFGHRISRGQVARIKERLRTSIGDRPPLDGIDVPAFPRPQRLLGLPEIGGVTSEKVRRVHALADTAIEGGLDTERLRGLPTDEALRQLRALPGLGRWTAEAVLLRGCGVADALPVNDDISREATAELYELGQLDDPTWREIAEGWRPYRMWATVLLRVAWQRRGGTTSYRRDRPRRNSPD